MNDFEIETHPLQPFLPANAKLLMLGSFPPPQTRWKMDFYYPNFQNDMWRILAYIFFKDKNYFLNLEQKNFKESVIKEFLLDQGIAIFDSAFQVRRLRSNASDKFLEIVTATDLAKLIQKIPQCQHIMTTGDKATDTMLLSMPAHTVKPSIGHSSEVDFGGRKLFLHRLPSSSRAYPLAFDKKVNFYKDFFQSIGLV